jgi:hypothetical protein
MGYLLGNFVFVGPPIVSALLVVSAIPIWHHNLGATPLVWIMIGSAAFILLCWGWFILALGLAGL